MPKTPCGADNPASASAAGPTNLRSPHVSGQRTNQSIQIRPIDGIEVEKVDLADAEIGKLLGNYGTGPTTTNDRYAKRAERPLTIRSKRANLAIIFGGVNCF